MKNTDDNDINELFIEATATKRAHERKVSTPKKVTTIKVRGTLEIALENYKATRRIHKQQIKALKSQIKSHKLLIKQAKTSYKLVKLADKK